MTDLGVLRYRVSRLLGRIVTRTAASLTLGRMPPFVSTSAVIEDGDRILVVIDPIRKEPILPGGHLRWTEKPSEAVVREVQEETGFAIRVRYLVGVFAGEDWSGEQGVVRIVYRATVVGGSIASSAEGEATWIPLDGFAASTSRDAPIIRAAKERLDKRPWSA